jgi:hypothetical protein
MEHCSDNAADRTVGAYWERRFCELAAARGFVFSPLQIGRRGSAAAYRRGADGKRWHIFTLPDVTIWSAPGQHHEIKHKEPTRRGEFGLEQYRFEALLDFQAVTQQAVLYTIHNHAHAGGREVMQNRAEDWFTADVRELRGKWSSSRGNSWVNGEKKQCVIYYWSAGLWQPLASLWGS